MVIGYIPESHGLVPNSSRFYGRRRYSPLEGGSPNRS